VLHGSADHDSTAQVSVPLSDWRPNLLPGVEVRLPRDEFDRGNAMGRNVSYGFVQNVTSGTVADGVSVTFAGETPDRPQLRTHLPGLSGSTVYLGDAPSIRRADENDALLDRFRMPVFVLRSNRNSSLIAAVHEPYQQQSFIEQVTLDSAATGARDAVVLSIRHHGVTDHIVHRLAATDSAPIVAGPLQTDGEVAFVRERDGTPEKMLLWGGKALNWGEQKLEAAGVYEGSVTGALRLDEGAPSNAFVVTGSLSEGERLRGKTVIVTFGDGSTYGYPISRVENGQGQTRILLESDPGVAITPAEARHLFFPGRTMPGSVSYRIRDSASVHAPDKSAPAPARSP
jgi:hypothetical protein